MDKDDIADLICELAHDAIQNIDQGLIEDVKYKLEEIKNLTKDIMNTEL